MSRKPKRVVDTNAMGAPAPMSNPYMQPTIDQQSNNMMGGNHHVPQSSAAPQMGGFTDNPANNSYGYSDFGGPQQHQQQQPQHSGQIGGRGPGGGGFPQHQQQQPAGPNFPGQFAMFQQPIVQDMALQYGQRLADQGKEQLEKYIPVTRLKYYFAVDNKYVINKLRLLFFPYTHRDWSLKYDQDNPVQPRYDINAPDLYIPVMAYITYVVLAGLVLGMQDRFSPEQLGIQASSALAYAIMELIVYSLTLYIGNIQTMLKTLDLMAFAGYKFVIINVCLVTSILFKSFGYYLCLLYSSVALGFFLVSFPSAAREIYRSHVTYPKQLIAVTNHQSQGALRIDAVNSGGRSPWLRHVWPANRRRSAVRS